MVEKESAGSFAARPYRLIAALKRDHWASLFRARGPEATFAAGQDLREHARVVRPDWPTARERDQDLRHHLELKRLLQKASVGFSRR